MKIALGAAVACAIALAGCSSATTDTAAAPAGPSPTPTDAPWSDVYPASDCAPGTRASIGSTECVAVGIHACPAGFVQDASGWGCRDVQPAKACEGATREALGATTCVPIGDCDAAFPPPNATVIVDPAAPVDGTHVHTIADGVAKAGPNGVVAIAKGTYSESLVLAAPVSIVGRCARDVVVTSPDGTSTGIEARADAHVSGLTLRGHHAALVVIGSANVTLDDSLVEKSIGSAVVAQKGKLTITKSRIVDTISEPTVGGPAVVVFDGNVTLRDSSVVRAQQAGVALYAATSTALVEHSIVRDTLTSDRTGAGAGIAIIGRSKVDVVESAIVGTTSNGIEITEGCEGTVTRSVVRGVAPNARGDHGHGIVVGAKGTASVEGTTVLDTAQNGIAAFDGGTMHVASSVVASGGIGGISASRGGTIDVDDTVVRDVFEVGVSAQDPTSRLSIKRSLVRDVARARDDVTVGFGAGATFGGAITIDDVAIESVDNVGVQVGGQSTSAPSSGTLSRLFVRGTRQAPTKAYGRGLEITTGGVVTVDRSMVVGVDETGIVAGQTGTSVTVTNSVIAECGRASELGHGIVGVGGARVAIAGSLLRDNGGAALAFSRASGRISSVLVTRNAVGIFVKGAELREVDALPADAADDEVLVQNGAFVDNATRVSAAEIPLPETPELRAPK